VAGCALLISLSLAPFGWGCSLKDHSTIKIADAIVVVIWILVPPIWFWYEYFFIWRRLPPSPNPDAWDEFKYAQDVSSKIWLAATSALLLLYFWKDIKPN
jgi:hypothetical protein